LENVSGHLTLGFADVLADLAEIGWSCEWGTYRASDVGAPHRRERIFILAHTNGKGSQGTNAGMDLAKGRRDARGHATQGADVIAANTDSASSETRIGRQGRGDTGRLQPVERGGSVVGSATYGDANGSDVGEIEKVQALSAESSGVCGVYKGRVAANTDMQTGRKTVSGVQAVIVPKDRTRFDAEISRIDWGKYAPAIRRWELTLGRNAPDPVVMRSDKRRLNPQFVEWMMGLPDGWVTGHGLSAAKELKMLGNGVVPQQAHAAITQLLERITP
jgi:DNA (cytosine-5)-methyltransferase 1